MMMKEVGDVQKKQDAQQQHWSIYNDSLTYISSWLDNMEAGLSQDQVIEYKNLYFRHLILDNIKTKLIFKNVLITRKFKFINNSILFKNQYQTESAT